MELVDAQIHTWLSDRPSRPWVRSYRRQHRDKLPYLLHAGQTNTTEMALVEMAEAGVDAALRLAPPDADITLLHVVDPRWAGGAGRLAAAAGGVSAGGVGLDGCRWSRCSMI